MRVNDADFTIVLNFLPKTLQQKVSGIFGSFQFTPLKYKQMSFANCQNKWTNLWCIIVISNLIKVCVFQYIQLHSFCLRKVLFCIILIYCQLQIN